jgi:hypothetical protein
MMNVGVLKKKFNSGFNWEIMKWALGFMERVDLGLGN